MTIINDLVSKSNFEFDFLSHLLSSLQVILSLSKQ